MELIGIPLQASNFISHTNLRLVVFSYLTGADLYHKIALLDKSYRKTLPISGLLDQEKLLKLKKIPARKTNLMYAFQIVDVVVLEINDDEIENINIMAHLIDF